jgi:WS/DGAT/MGAT family acyltransferase
MQQLSSLDAVFLSMETPETPGHIGGLAILDPSTHPQEAFDFERFVEFAAERLALCPRFAWKLQEVPLGLDRPYWVETGALDFRAHIHRMAVPSPGGQRELAELACLLYPRPLDRSRPLWDMTFIEGLQGGRVALLWRVHHCLMDGASGAGLVELLFDLEPTPAERPLVTVDDAAHAGAPVRAIEMMRNGLRNASRRPRAALAHLSTAGRDVVDRIKQNGLGGTAMAPRTSFNGVLSAQRSVGWSRISLERVKQLKRELDVTVNDVVLAITSESVRRYLDARDQLPEESLFASVPVSVRAEGDKSIGNQVAEVSIEWATDREDPIERIYAIHEAANAAKASVKAGGFNLVDAMAESLSPGMLSLFARATAGSADSALLPANAVVSNVPMSPVPMYVAGAKIEGMVPMSLLAPTQGFNITVVSYNGEMHFGVIADPELVDNVWELADAIPKALGELEAAAEADPRFSS